MYFTKKQRKKVPVIQKKVSSLTHRGTLPFHENQICSLQEGCSKLHKSRQKVERKNSLFGMTNMNVLEKHGVERWLM